MFTSDGSAGSLEHTEVLQWKIQHKHLMTFQPGRPDDRAAAAAAASVQRTITSEGAVLTDCIKCFY